MDTAERIGTVDAEEADIAAPVTAQVLLQRLCYKSSSDAGSGGHDVWFAAAAVLSEMGRRLARHWLESTSVPRSTNGLAGERHMRLLWCSGCGGLQDMGICGKNAPSAVSSCTFGPRWDERKSSDMLSLKTASKGGKHSPCTNVPLKSCFCQDGRWVRKYSMAHHVRTEHAVAVAVRSTHAVALEFRAKSYVSESEKVAVKERMQSIRPRKRPKKGTSVTVLPRKISGRTGGSGGRGTRQQASGVPVDIDGSDDEEEEEEEEEKNEEDDEEVENEEDDEEVEEEEGDEGEEEEGDEEEDEGGDE